VHRCHYHAGHHAHLAEVSVESTVTCGARVDKCVEYSQMFCAVPSEMDGEGTTRVWAFQRYLDEVPAAWARFLNLNVSLTGQIANMMLEKVVCLLCLVPAAGTALAVEAHIVTKGATWHGGLRAKVDRDPALSAAIGRQARKLCVDTLVLLAAWAATAHARRTFSPNTHFRTIECTAACHTARYGTGSLIVAQCVLRADR